MVSREPGVALDMNSTAPKGVITSMMKPVFVPRFVVNVVSRFSSLTSKISPRSNSVSLSPNEAMLAALKSVVLVKFRTRFSSL